MDFAAMQHHQLMHNGQSQAGAARLAAARLIHAVETIKDVRQMLGGNTGAVVFDLEHRVAP